MFLAIIFGGGDAIDTDADAEVELEEHEKAWSLRRSILNLCQDITYVISKKRIIPPKHYSMGLTIHQMSERSKKAVNLLNWRCNSPKFVSGEASTVWIR